MKPRYWLFASLLIVLLVALLVSQIPPTPTVQIWVARQEIPAGKIFPDELHLWASEYFIQRTIRADHPMANNASLVQALDELKKQKVIRRIQRNQPIFREHLSSNLGFDIPVGWVAIGVRMTWDDTVTLNSKVQVLGLDRTKNPSKAWTVLENVVVAALDGKPRRDDLQTSMTITIAVSPEQAQILARAETKGPLTIRKHPPELVEVFVARRDLPVGQTIDDVDAYFEVETYPKELAPQNRLSRQDLVGQTTKRYLFEGQFALPRLFQPE